MVRGESPRPALNCHCCRVFHSTYAKKQTQNMRLDPLGLVVPDRPQAQIGLVHAEGRLGFGELDVGSPQLFIAPVGDVGAQE